MHPIERLRHVARSGSVEHRDLVRETAGALAALGGDDSAGLVLSCKRLVERQPTSGPVWWLCARILGAADARAEAWRCADEIDGDPTPRHLADALPEEATVTVLGWPELASEALVRRGDLAVLVIDAQGDAAAFTRRLLGADLEAVDVAESGTGAAAAASQVVVLEASAIGPDALLAPAGSHAAAAVAHHAGVPVWVMAGVGRVLPRGLWEVLVNRLDHDDPWDAVVELVPLDLVDVVVGPVGARPVGELAKRTDCAAAPELLERD